MAGQTPGMTGIPEVEIAPGRSVSARIVCERKNFEGVIRFEIQNLPHGVIVANLGLNGITLLGSENEREIFLAAAKWVPDQDRLIFAEESVAGKQTSRPLLLKVRSNASK